MYSKIEQYIFFALKKYRRINLPGFGVLEITKTEAGSHPVHHEYEAPGEIIQFCPNAAHGENLADCLAKDAMLDKDLASKLVNTFSEEFSAKLENKNKVEIKGIGVFFEKGKVLHFQPEPSVELTPGNYGLFNFKAGAPVKEKIIAPQKTGIKKKRRVPAIFYISLILGAGITAAFSVFPKESNEAWNKVISIFNKGNNDSITSNNNSDTTNTDTVAVVNVDTNTSDTIEADTAETEITVNNNNTIVPDQNYNTRSTGSGYHVIANCFSMKELADNYVQNLINQGFSQANILGVNSSGLHLVSFNNGFATKEEARKYMFELQSKYGRTDLWVHCHNCK